MAISATITAELTNLQTQVAAAKPLIKASRATVKALKLNAAQLVNDVQAALVAPNVTDTYIAATDPGVITAGVLLVSTAATDQNNLSLMRGVVGRVASNLAQIPS